jgi:hypothetical protein
LFHTKNTRDTKYTTINFRYAFGCYVIHSIIILKSSVQFAHITYSRWAAGGLYNKNIVTQPPEALTKTFFVVFVWFVVFVRTGLVS